MDLRVLAQPFHSIAVFRVEIAQIIEGELAGCPAFEGVDRYEVIFIGLFVVVLVGLLGVVIGITLQVIMH